MTGVRRGHGFPPWEDELSSASLLPQRWLHALFIPQNGQIAMSLRDTTTDENELAMSYTIPRSECAEVGARRRCHEPATNLIGDVFRHPPSVAPNREARRERSLSKDVRLAASFEKES